MSIIELKQNIEKEKKSGKIIFGSDKAIKQLKKGKVSKIFLSKDCPIEKKEALKELSKKYKADVIELDKTKEEIREIIKKPFSSIIISFLK